MRIALVINTSWNIYNFRTGLIKSFLNEGHQVIAIAPKDTFSEKLVEMGCEYFPIKMDSRGVNPFKDSLLIFELIRLYRKANPDIILHYTVKPNIFGTIAAGILRKPVINNVCGLGTAFLNRGIITTLVSFLYRLSFKYSNKVFFQNYEDCRLFVVEKMVDENKTQVLPGSGINLKKFIPSNTIPGKNFTFLMMGRVIREKGIMEYIEAIKRIKKINPEISFQLIGDDDQSHRRAIPKELINQWVKDGLVDYLGKVEDVRPVIDNANCIVLPSYREGTSRTLLEAAALAKPIITTDTPGCRNIVDNKVNGLLCKSRDVDSLVDNINEILSLSPEQLREMGIKGREKVEKEFDEKIVIDHYKLAIDNLMS